MYKSIELINSIEHKNGAVKDVTDYSFSKELSNCLVTVSEFFEACKDYPILFAKDAKNEWFASVMLGLKDKDNLSVEENGSWKSGKYIPAFIRRYPFVFVSDKDKLALAYDSTYKATKEANPTKAFFDENGNNSEFLNATLRFLTNFQADALSTAKFVSELEKLELLEQKSASIKTPSNETITINGFFVVNEDKLKNLSEKKKSDLCKRGAIPLITAHLISLSNIRKLSL
ncbi:MAG: SapC family protein [Arcobacteraceae bacterium]